MQTLFYNQWETIKESYKILRHLKLRTRRSLEQKIKYIYLIKISDYWYLYKRVSLKYWGTFDFKIDYFFLMEKILRSDFLRLQKIGTIITFIVIHDAYLLTIINTVKLLAKNLKITFYIFFI